MAPKLIRLTFERIDKNRWAMKWSFGKWVIVSGEYDSKDLALEQARALYKDVREAVDKMKKEKSEQID